MEIRPATKHDLQRIAEMTADFIRYTQDIRVKATGARATLSKLVNKLQR